MQPRPAGLCFWRRVGKIDDMLKALAALAVLYVVWFAILGVVMAETYWSLARKIGYGWTLFKQWIWVMAVLTAVGIVLGLISSGVSFGNS